LREIEELDSGSKRKKMKVLEFEVSTMIQLISRK